MPSLLAIGLPANVANATSNVALLPGAATSAWSFRDELRPVGGVPIRLLAAITFAGGLAGSALLVLTPATRSISSSRGCCSTPSSSSPSARGRRRGCARVAIGRSTLLAVQALLGLYGGYLGGGVGLMTTTTYALLARHTPRELFAPRTVMLAVANAAAAIVFVAAGLVRWSAAAPMLVGSVIDGWLGARVGKRLPAGAIRAWTLVVTAATTAVFFWRAYA